jgi:starch synthase
MNILFVTSEFADFAKVGGLGDVSAALPRALSRQGLDVRVLLPGYQKAIDGLCDVRIVATLPPQNALPRRLLAQGRTHDGLVVYLVVEPRLYQRDGGVYSAPDGADWPDNDIRFASLALTAAEIAGGAPALDWRPDLVHAQDWPAALAPAYVKWRRIAVPSIVTIHNLAHQGLYPAERCADLGVPDQAFSIYGAEFHGRLSFLKAGLYYADHVTTVSPNYAREITQEAHGGGLHGLLAGIAADGRLTGIVNGVGDEWDPAADPYIGAPFDEADTSAKVWIKNRVCTSLCLAERDAPLFGVVSRLVPQKGLDLVEATAGEIVRRGGQIAILGVGDPTTEDLLRKTVRAYPDDIAMLNGFNEPMAHRIIAASDFYLMPSRFEPCGLSQMHAQLYGALPIVHATGGLADTVQDGENGFVFRGFDSLNFLTAVARAFETYAAPAELKRMRHAAMTRRVSYDDAAREYLKVYVRVAGRPVLRVSNPPAASSAAKAGAAPTLMRAAHRAPIL